MVAPLRAAIVAVGDYDLISNSDHQIFIKSNSTSENLVGIRQSDNDNSGFIHGTGNLFGLKDSGADWIIRSNYSVDTRLYVGANIGLAILSNRDVGIGTGSPTERLHVQGGNLLISSGYMNINRSNYSAKLILDTQDPAANNQPSYIELSGEDVSSEPYSWRLQPDLAYDSGFSINTWDSTNGLISRLFIEKDGNVGIATQAPEKKFHVNGDAKFDGEVTIASIPEQGDIDMGIFGNP